MCQVWLELPYLLQVWYILTILAASMVNRAQLAASLAALFQQYQLGSTKVIKEFQVSHTKNGNHLHNRWFWRICKFVAPAHYSSSTGQSLEHKNGEKNGEKTDLLAIGFTP